MSDATEQYADINVRGDPTGHVLIVTLDRPAQRNPVVRGVHRLLRGQRSVAPRRNDPA